MDEDYIEVVALMIGTVSHSGARTLRCFVLPSLATRDATERDPWVANLSQRGAQFSNALDSHPAPSSNPPANRQQADATWPPE